MASLLTSATANTTGTGASHSGPCTVWVRGTLGGATVVIQAADVDSDANYVKVDNISQPAAGTFKDKGCLLISATGTYYVRAVLSNAGSSTSVTVTTTQ